MTPPPEPAPPPVWRGLLQAGLWLSALVAPLHAQAPPELTASRQAFSEWLGHAPMSPSAIVARTPIGNGLTIGPASADLPLDGVSARVEVKGDRVVLTDSSGSRTVPASGAVRIGPYLFSSAGPRGRTLLLVFGDTHRPVTASWYAYSSAQIFTVDLRGPATPPRRPRLDADGIEVEALEVGKVTVPLVICNLRFSKVLT